jgi:hypothetical protein
METKKYRTIERAKEALSRLNLSPRKASMMATGKPDALRHIFNRGVAPTMTRLADLAAILEMNPLYLAGETDDPHIPEPLFRHLNRIRQGKGLPPFSRSGWTDNRQSEAVNETDQVAEIISGIKARNGGAVPIFCVESIEYPADSRRYVDEFGREGSVRLLPVNFHSPVGEYQPPQHMNQDLAKYVYGMMGVDSSLVARFERQTPIFFVVGASLRGGESVLLGVEDWGHDSEQWAEMTRCIYGRFIRTEEDAYEIEIKKYRYLIPISNVLFMHKEISLHYMLGLRKLRELRPGHARDAE